MGAIYVYLNKHFQVSIMFEKENYISVHFFVFFQLSIGVETQNTQIAYVNWDIVIFNINIIKALLEQLLSLVQGVNIFLWVDRYMETTKQYLYWFSGFVFSVQVLVNGLLLI